MKTFKTPSRTSPRGGRRGCLCPDKTYSRACCDGSLQAQGIGVIQKTIYFKMTWDSITTEWTAMNYNWERAT